jgi:hypothetical protein
MGTRQAEILPAVAGRHGLAPGRPAVQLIEAGPTILAGSPPQLTGKAASILADLGVRIRTNATIAAATQEGFRLTDGQLVQGGVFVWAGGVKAPELMADSELPAGHNGRVKVDRYLRVLDHPEIYVAGDLASVTDPRTGHVLPPLAQVALEEGETVARNLTRSWRTSRSKRSPSTTRGSSSRPGPAAGSPTSPASPPAGGCPTCSKTPSSGSTASPSGTCAAGTRQPGDRCPSSGFGAELHPRLVSRPHERQAPTRKARGGPIPPGPTRDVPRFACRMPCSVPHGQQCRPAGTSARTAGQRAFIRVHLVTERNECSGRGQVA